MDAFSAMGLRPRDLRGGLLALTFARDAALGLCGTAAALWAAQHIAHALVAYGWGGALV